MSKEELIEYKKILTQTLRDFITFCDNHNLKYSLAYGSVIGVLRHQGFIPWDDDIDVIMPKSDYDKLLSMKAELYTSLKANYKIYDFEDEGYYLPFAKFCNQNTTVWEDKNMPFVLGAYIDIFPLYDSADMSYIKTFHKYLFYFSRYYFSLSHFTLKDVIRGLFLCKFGLLKRCLNITLAKLFKRLIINKIYLNNEKLLSYKGDYYYSICSAYGKKNFYPKSMIFPTKKALFEGLWVNIPHEADEYCTHLYGDYMKLPPFEQQKTHHLFYYYNLKRRLEIKDLSFASSTCQF